MSQFPDMWYLIFCNLASNVYQLFVLVYMHDIVPVSLWYKCYYKVVFWVLILGVVSMLVNLYFNDSICLHELLPFVLEMIS